MIHTYILIVYVNSVCLSVSLCVCVSVSVCLRAMAESMDRTPLLDGKNPHGDCPGCLLARRKIESKEIPLKETAGSRCVSRPLRW